MITSADDYILKVTKMTDKTFQIVGVEENITHLATGNDALAFSDETNFVYLA